MLVVLILAAILIIGYFALVRPQFNQYQNSKAKTSQMEEDKKVKIKKLLVFKKTLSDYKKISMADKEKINNILPDSLDESSLYMNIAGLAKHNNINLVIDGILVNEIDENTAKKKPLINQEAETAIGGPKRVSIKLDLSEVNYIELKKFFEYLENNVRIFDVQSFAYNPEEGKITLEINSYFLD